MAHPLETLFASRHAVRVRIPRLSIPCSQKTTASGLGTLVTMAAVPVRRPVRAWLVSDKRLVKCGGEVLRRAEPCRSASDPPGKHQKGCCSQVDRRLYRDTPFSF
jgi:hypothetical protein